MQATYSQSIDVSLSVCRQGAQPIHLRTQLLHAFQLFTRDNKREQHLYTRKRLYCDNATLDSAALTGAIRSRWMFTSVVPRTCKPTDATSSRS